MGGAHGKRLIPVKGERKAISRMVTDSKDGRSPKTTTRMRYYVLYRTAYKTQRNLKAAAAWWWWWGLLMPSLLSLSSKPPDWVRMARIHTQVLLSRPGAGVKPSKGPEVQKSPELIARPCARVLVQVFCASTHSLLFPPSFSVGNRHSVAIVHTFF